MNFKFEVTGESEQEIRPFTQALDMKAALHKIRALLRQHVKYRENCPKEVEGIYKQFFEILSSNGISLED